MNQVDSISVNNDFWIQFTGNRISFTFKKLPEKIHFTIAFNSNSPDINFHITKNNGNILKPSIEIARIDKQLLLKFQNLFFAKIFSSLFEKVDIKSYHLNSRKTFFFPLNNLNEPNNKIERKINNGLKQLYVQKGKKIKFEGNIENNVYNLLQSNKYINPISKSLIQVSKIQLNTMNGMLFYKKGIACRIDGHWFRFKEKLSLFEIFSSIIEPFVLKQLNSNIERAIILIKNASSKEDTQHIKMSIRL
jgi:hypothetical protein